VVSGELNLGAPVLQILKDDGSIVPTPGNEDFSDLLNNAAFMELFEAN